MKEKAKFWLHNEAVHVMAIALREEIWDFGEKRYRNGLPQFFSRFEHFRGFEASLLSK